MPCGLASEAYPALTQEKIFDNYSTKPQWRTTFRQIAKSLETSVKRMIKQQAVMSSTTCSIEIYSKLALILTNIFVASFTTPEKMGVKVETLPGPNGQDVSGILSQKSDLLTCPT